IYVAALRGTPLPPEPPTASSYRDFVFLERQAERSPEAQAFFVEKLAGVTPERLPRWPNARALAAREAQRKPSLWLDEDVVERLHRLSRLAEVPYRTVILAAHVRLASHLAGRSEVVTGLTTHGRPEEAGGDQVRGLFLNTLPFRLDLAPGSWTELVRQVFAAELALMPYRRFPLAAIQKLAGGQVLFESAFSFLHFHSFGGAVQPGRMALPRAERDPSVTHFPLAATFSRSPTSDLGLSLTLERNDPDLCLAQVRTIQAAYLAIFAAMAAEPGERHETAALLSPAERHQTIVEWNGPALGFRSDFCLHEEVARRAQEHPRATALVDCGAGDLRLSYRELDRRADRLAVRLQALGVGPEVRVGLCLERSAGMLVAILAVLKAGGAYVPLDPAYPRTRLDFVLGDSRARVLVSERHLVAKLPAVHCDVVFLGDEEASGLQGRTAERPAPSGVSPENAAYVIYTSGSTGNPKGVVVTHANVARLFTATDPWFGFGARDVWTLFHSYAFDFSVWEIWGALLYGGRLVVVPYL
ncbi:MAG TPA: AMP-binding protein, partial [Thermoanaerobaculia bacterium]